MKKVGYALLMVIIAFVGYGIYSEITFTPLEKKDFKLLFPNYNGSIKVSYHKDFIGWSRGDVFELYIYSFDNVYINPDYPKIGQKWEYTTLPDPLMPESLITTKWLRCPLDSLMQVHYSSELSWITDNSTNEGETLKQDMKDVTNYYCCIYVSEQEKYLMLYSPSKNIMYYIRQRGF